MNELATKLVFKAPNRYTINKNPEFSGPSVRTFGFFGDVLGFVGFGFLTTGFLLDNWI